MPSDEDVQVQAPPVTSDHDQVDQVRRPRRSPAPPHGSREPIDQPVRVAWREGTLTRAEELEALHAWVATQPDSKRSGELAEAIYLHLAAARDAARYKRPWFRNPPPGSSSSAR